MRKLTFIISTHEMKTSDLIEQSADPLEVVIQIDDTDELMKHFGIYKNENEQS